MHAQLHLNRCTNQPLLLALLACSYGPGGLRAYPAAGAPPRMGAEEARTQKCPRCRKEYLSTINQRRCIASHLGASGGAKAARGVAGAHSNWLWGGLRGIGSCTLLLTAV